MTFVENFKQKWAKNGNATLVNMALYLVMLKWMFWCKSINAGIDIAVTIPLCLIDMGFSIYFIILSYHLGKPWWWTFGSVRNRKAKAIYDDYNKRLFGGTLNAVPIQVEADINIIGEGVVKGVLAFVDKRRDGISYSHVPLEINIYGWFSRNEFHHTILHEMVHQYLMQSDGLDKHAHDEVFQHKLSELCKKVGIKDVDYEKVEAKIPVNTTDANTITWYPPKNSEDSAA